MLDELYRRQPLEMMGQKGQKNLNFVTLAAAINFVCKQGDNRSQAVMRFCQETERALELSTNTDEHLRDLQNQEKLVTLFMDNTRIGD